MLLGRRQACVQRQDLELRRRSGRGVVPTAAQGVGDVVDLALAAQEHQHVAGPGNRQLVDCVAHRLHLIAVVAGLVADRPVALLDRIRATADLHHRGRSLGTREVCREALGVDGRRRDDEVQVGALPQQPVQVPEQEVDVQAALVGLVDDDRVVPAQHAVALDLGQQDAVGHHLHQRVVADVVGEPHRVPDRAAQLDAHLVGHPLGDRPRGNTTWLCVPDQAVRPSPQFEAQLGQLRALARPGLAGHDDHLVVADRGQQVVVSFGDRQRGRDVQRAPLAQLIDRRETSSDAFVSRNGRWAGRRAGHG